MKVDVLNLDGKKVSTTDLPAAIFEAPIKPDLMHQALVRQQANARLQRQGQKEPVIIHHLVAEGTLDTHVMAALKAKRMGQDAMMDAVKMLVKEVQK